MKRKNVLTGTYAADNYQIDGANNFKAPITTLRPLLKWPGGKFGEYPKFCDSIADSYDRYIEPFAGGAGVCFAHSEYLNGKRIYLNDYCTDLIDFYQAVKVGTYKKDFIEVGQWWNGLTAYAESVHDRVRGHYRSDDVVMADAIPRVPNAWDSILNEYVHRSVADKIKRIKNIEAKENVTFDDNALPDHTETAVRAAFYNYFRAIINGDQVSSIPKTIAWYFVREFCYSGMFRFSRGKFNMPYGGISYNSKNIMAKIELINSEQLIHMFERTEFTNKDFGDFLDEINVNENDFIFLDPPYDSTFSSYDNKVFGQAEHVRLRNILVDTPAKWMLVIGHTSFVHNLYGSIPGVNVSSFEKTYMTNIRNRTDRDALHMIFKNYQ